MRGARVLAWMGAFAFGGAALSSAHLGNSTLAGVSPDDVDQPSEYEVLAEEASQLGPPDPESIPALQQWIQRAEALLETDSPNSSSASLAWKHALRGPKPMSLAGETIKSLEAEKWARSQQILGLFKDRRRKPEKLARKFQSLECKYLLELSAQRVLPCRLLFGEEAQGLALAMHGLELSLPSQRTSAHCLVGWGQLALGAMDKAKAALSRADKSMLRGDEEGQEMVSLLRKDCERHHREDYRRETNVRQAEIALELALLKKAQLYGLCKALLRKEHLDPRFGWSMPKRLAFAEAQRIALSPFFPLSDGDGQQHAGPWRVRWEQARAPMELVYGELVASLAQDWMKVGLVPIGPDLESGLWEFWQPASGDEPQRDEVGALKLREGDGLVFVLLPGGFFWMGAQAADPEGVNYDALAEENEALHQVELSAFFFSKYEVTQAQWKRLVGENPSYYGKEGLYELEWSESHSPPDLMQPVENVSWERAVEVLGWWGLRLPSEAQWEYGARAGTQTPWSSGRDRTTLFGRANLIDQAAARGGADWPGLEEWPELDDGYSVHSPVGSFAANDFGLHDMHGNLFELCLDGYGPYENLLGRDPLKERGPEDHMVLRGGSWHYAASLARSAYRGHRRSWEGRASNNCGVRPAILFRD